MRWSSRRDGAVVIYDDAPAYEPGDDDMMVVEAVVASFTPVRDGLQCSCGAVLKHRATACGAELSWP
jgi:hypothetical protein